VWQFSGSSRTALFLIVGQSPRRAYRLVDLTSGKWEAVNYKTLDGGGPENLPPNAAWRRVS